MAKEETTTTEIIEEEPMQEVASDSVEQEPVQEIEEAVEEEPVQEVALDSVEQEAVEEKPVQEVVEENKTKLESFLLNYTETMKPRAPVNPDDGASLNYQLWKTLEEIINKENYEDFKNDFKTVTKYFVDYSDGAFGPIYLFRFSEYWRWSTDELSAFQNLLNLLTLTADPAKRQEGLKQVDLNKALAEGFTEQAKQNITSFLVG